MTDGPHARWARWMAAKKKADPGMRLDERETAAEYYEARAKDPTNRISPTFAWPEGFDRAIAFAKVSAHRSCKGIPDDAPDAAIGGALEAVLWLEGQDKADQRKLDKLRQDALERQDALAAIRLDSAPTGSDLVAARFRVASSGVPEHEREAYAQRIAAREAHIRASEHYVSRVVQIRCDGDGAETVEPTQIEIDRARRALQAEIPLKAEARTDAFAAAAHEQRVMSRAREDAATRHRRNVEHDARATLPPPPPVVELPMARLPSQRGDELHWPDGYDRAKALRALTKAGRTATCSGVKLERASDLELLVELQGLLIVQNVAKNGTKKR